jgi:hypothetical protein
MPATSASGAISTFKRADFSARSDRYSMVNGATAVPADLSDAIKGVAPVDVSGSVLSDAYVLNSSARLSEYRKYRRYFEGKHFTVEYDGGNKKTVYNFCKQVVDKRASWVAGKGFSFLSEKGNELVSGLLHGIWKSNFSRILIRKSAKVSLATGDAFWYFTVKTKDSVGKKLPKSKWHVSICALNPSYCFPIWTEDNPGEMKAIMLQFPVMGSTAGDKSRIFTAFMTPETIRFYMDFELTSEVDNALGLVPVVHIPSSPYGDEAFGNSCLKDIIPLNDRYNEIGNSVDKIIKYHGEPTTIVYGARLSQMERGANKVWSNLPPPDQARVENLEMKGDLTAIDKHLGRIEHRIYHLAKTPKQCYDSEGLAISNTSGVAMQLMFQPIIEATIEEQDGYSKGISQGNKIIAAIHENVFGEDLSALADNPETYLDIQVSWASLLPRDEQAEIDVAEKKRALGVWSRAEAARRLSDVNDTERLAMELAADDRYDIAIASEKAKALQMSPVNFSAPFLSSLFLSEDLVDIAKDIGKLSEDNSNGDNGDGAANGG